MSIDSMIGRAINVEGYTNLVAYDENHPTSYGYWICKECRINFYAGSDPMHYKACSLKERVQKISSLSDPKMIYVLGSRETGFASPFGKDNIQAIKELAKTQWMRVKMGSGLVSSPYDAYIMDPANKVVEMRHGGRFNQAVILKYEDGSEWVFLNNKPEERFCGFLYLQKALNDLNVSKVQAAENKIAIHDRKIIYLSKYYGDNKPGFMDLSAYNEELIALKQKTKFVDTAGNANLREQNGVVYVFDTEKGSFDKSVHAKIDSFIQQHDMIRSALENERDQA